MVALLVLFISHAQAFVALPVATEFEARAGRMFAAGRAPRTEEFEHAWFCVQTTKTGYVAEAEPPVVFKDDRLQPSEFAVGIKTEKRDTALVVTRANGKEALRILEAPKGLRLIVERSGVAKKNAPLSAVTGTAVSGYALCLPRTEVFGEASDKDFLKYAKATFEVGRLPTNSDFRGDWTCAYQPKKTPLTLFTPPQILVKNGSIFMPEFNGKKSVRMEVNDKAWVASLEDGDVRAAYRLQRSPEGIRLLQEASGVEVTGRPPMGLVKPSTTTAVCLKTEELTERLFGPGTLGEANGAAPTSGIGSPAGPGSAPSRVR